MPWGSRGDLPTDLACWLAGLGVGLLTNPPRRPQDNGVIERYQGVGKAWGEPHRCGAAAELQRRLDELDRWQRDLYPIAQGRSRREVYPGLEHSGRSYDPAQELAMWELGRAWAWVGAHHPFQVKRLFCNLELLLSLNHFPGKRGCRRAVGVSL